MTSRRPRPAELAAMLRAARHAGASTQPIDRRRLALGVLVLAASGDGMVNGGDLGILLSSWGATLPTGVGDVNHDGVVNGADLAVLLSSWGSCP
jgi:hypothetical protein